MPRGSTSCRRSSGAAPRRSGPCCAHSRLHSRHCSSASSRTMCSAVDARAPVDIRRHAAAARRERGAAVQGPADVPGRRRERCREARTRCLTILSRGITGAFDEYRRPSFLFLVGVPGVRRRVRRGAARSCSAAGVARGWRSALCGVWCSALLVLAVIAAALGPALTKIPIDALRLVVGALLLDLRPAVAAQGDPAARERPQGTGTTRTRSTRGRSPGPRAPPRPVDASPYPTGMRSRCRSRACCSRASRSCPPSLTVRRRAGLASGSRRLGAAAASRAGRGRRRRWCARRSAQGAGERAEVRRRA